LPKRFFLFTPHPTLSHKGRGELEEKTFGKRYKIQGRESGAYPALSIIAKKNPLGVYPRGFEIS
jgi:hypothetical protein